MANNINLASFEFDDSKLLKSIEEIQKKMFELQKTQKSNSREAAILQKSYNDLTLEQNKLAISGQKNTEAYKKNAEEIKNIENQQQKLFLSQKDLQIQQQAVNREYSDTVTILKQNSDSNLVLLSETERINNALAIQVTGVNEANAANKELRIVRNQLNATTEEGRKNIELINAQIERNTEFVRNNVSATEQQRMAIGDYSNQIQDAFANINIFNGGLSGFIERSNEAGGTGNLLTNSFKEMRAGILGAARAALVFIATPIGAAIAALGVAVAVVVGAFKLMTTSLSRTEEGSDKLAQVTAVFSGILKKLFDIIEPLGNFIFDVYVVALETAGKATQTYVNIVSKALDFLGFEKAAKSIQNYSQSVKDGIESSKELAKQEAILAEKNRKANESRSRFEQQNEKLRQLRDDDTKGIQERIKANDDLGKSLVNQLNTEKEIAQQALIVAELKIKESGKSTEALDEERKAKEKLAEIDNRITRQSSEQLIQRNSLLKEQRDKEIAAAAAALELKLQKNREEINLLTAQQGFRAKNLQEQFDFSVKISEKEIKNLQDEFKGKKITETQYNTEVLNIRNELARQQAEIVAENAALELEDFVRKNKTKIDIEKGLTKQIVSEEIIRLRLIEQKRIQEQEVLLKQGLIIEQEYRREILAINDEFNAQETEINKRFEAQKKADRDLNRSLENQAELLRIGNEEAQKFELQKEIAEFQYNEKKLILENQRANELIDEANYQLALNNIEKENSLIRKKISEEEFNSRLDIASTTYGNLAELAGKETAAGKAFAVAQTIIDTYQSAISAFKSLSGIPIVGPALGTIAAAAAVKTGLDNVKRINQTQIPSFPKAEKGAMFEIGGKRHSSGGTKFTGEDGTNFEAEKGEKLFVLNRRASAVFSPFLSSLNQKYGGVSFSREKSYLAQGGAVASQSRIVQNSFENTNNEFLIQSIADAVYNGSLNGSKSGSNIGTNSGFVELTNNRQINLNTQF